MRLRIPLHGRTHTPTGSDPIPGIGGIQYNEGTYGPAGANVGDYLTVEVSNYVGWILDSGAYFYIDSDEGGSHILEVDRDGSVYWYLRGSDYYEDTEGGNSRHYTRGGAWSIDTEAGGLDVDTGGGEIDLITHGGAVTIDATSGGDLSLQGADILAQSFTGSISLNAATGLSFDAGDDHVHTLAAGKTFTLKDSFGNPKIQWTEGTNDLHIPTGGTVVADL